PEHPRSPCDAPVMKERTEPNKVSTRRSLHKTTAVAKAVPRAEPRTRASGSHQRKMPVVEGKAKAVATDEKAEPVAKQVAARGDSHNRFRSLRKYPKRLRQLRNRIRLPAIPWANWPNAFRTHMLVGTIYEANKDTCRRRGKLKPIESNAIKKAGH